MSELLKCPFCGGKAQTSGGRERAFAVWCTNCGAGVNKPFEETAIAAWNSRAEHTCKPTEEYCCKCGQDLVLCDMSIGPNGGAVELDPPILFNYCPNCGAKVVK